MFGYSPFSSTTNFGVLTSSTISSNSGRTTTGSTSSSLMPPSLIWSPWSSPAPVLPVAARNAMPAAAKVEQVAANTITQDDDEEVVYQHGNVEVLVTSKQIQHNNNNFASPSSTQQQQHPTRRPSSIHNHCFPPNKPNVLQLEGDAFVINSNNICRTLYRLVNDNDESSSGSSLFEIEELYNIKQATKEFILRESNNIAEDHDNDEDFVIHLGKQVHYFDNNNNAHHDSSNIFINEIDHQSGDGGIFGSSAGTGGTTWESSLVMSLFFGQYPHLLVGDVLELGSGVGVGAIMTHRAVDSATAATDIGATTENTSHRRQDNHSSNNGIKSVTLSDGNMKVLQQCRSNLIQNGFTVLRNGKGDNNDEENKESVTIINTVQLNWHSPHLIYDVNGRTYDTIVASDCIYLYPDVKAFAKTVATLLKKRQQHDNSNHIPTFHYFGPSNRAPLQEFIKELCHVYQMKVTLNPLDMIRYRLKEDCHDIVSKVASSHSSTFVHMEVTHTIPTTSETSSSSSSSGGDSMNEKQ